MNRCYQCWALFFACLVVTALVAFAAKATECPQGMPSCKVLILSPDEERALTGPNMILQTAEQGRYLDLGQVVKYFRDKLAAAPAGEVKPPEKPQMPKPLEKPEAAK